MKVPKLATFARDEAGAITVDWIVLTAATIALAAMLLGVMHARSDGLADNTGTHMETHPSF